MADRSDDEVPRNIKAPENTSSKRIGFKSNVPCSGRTVLCIILLFVLLIMALLGVVFWSLFGIASPEHCAANNTTRQPVNVRYPGFFRTRDEQLAHDEMRTKLIHYQVINETVPTNYTCTKTCFGLATAIRKKRHYGDVYACCLTQTYYIRPDVYTNVYKQERIITQLKEQQLFQFFEIEDCRQARGCQGCQCVQDYNLVYAVVNISSNFDHPDDVYSDLYGLDKFIVPGCCKCLNIL